MRLLLIIICSVFALWGGYWYIGQSTLETQLGSWFDQRRDAGWQADYSDLNTRGFPNRFDTTITDIALADPNTGLVWSAPFFQILALSYKPHHIIAIWPNSQTLATPFETISITSQDMRASLVFDPGLDLAVNRASIVLDGFGLSSDAGWAAKIADGQLALRQTPTVANSYDLSFEANSVEPASRILQILDPAKILPDHLQTLKIEATGLYDAPWDRYAIESRRPQLTQLNLKLAQATWGDLDLRLAGELDIDATGYPTGTLSVKAKNWREMLDIAMASGVLPAQYGPTLESGLKAIAGLSGNSSTIDAPISFKNGRIWLGFIPLGPAPQLVLR